MVNIWTRGIFGCLLSATSTKKYSTKLGERLDVVWHDLQRVFSLALVTALVGWLILPFTLVFDDVTTCLGSLALCVLKRLGAGSVFFCGCVVERYESDDILDPGRSNRQQLEFGFSQGEREAGRFNVKHETLWHGREKRNTGFDF